MYTGAFAHEISCEDSDDSAINLARRTLTKLEELHGDAFWSGHGWRRRISPQFIVPWLTAAGDREDKGGGAQSPPLMPLKRCTGCGAPAAWDRVWNHARQGVAHRLHWRCPTSGHKASARFDSQDMSCSAFSNWYSNCNKVHAWIKEAGETSRKPVFFNFVERIHQESMADKTTSDNFRTGHLRKKYRGLRLRRSDGEEDPYPVYDVIGPGISWRHHVADLKKGGHVDQLRHLREGRYYLRTGIRTGHSKTRPHGEMIEGTSLYEINDALHQAHIKPEDNRRFRFVAASEAWPANTEGE